MLAVGHKISNRLSFASVNGLSSICPISIQDRGPVLYRAIQFDRLMPQHQCVMPSPVTCECLKLLVP